MKKAGVIDIGSNTIKLLVASDEGGKLNPLHTSIEECRISKGISRDRPILLPEAMDRGLAAVQNLIGIARERGVSKIHIVATSAVRDAANGRAFADIIRHRCDHEVEILTGQQEAEAIAFGLSFDPAVVGTHDFYHFDLGGGSLEFNEIRQGDLHRAISMPLGAVRLTEMFVDQPHQPMKAEEQEAIQKHVVQTLEAQGIATPPHDLPLIFTGGSVAVARSLISDKPIADPSPESAQIFLSQLESLYRKLSPIPYEERLRFNYLPPNRADVVCAAILVLTSLISYCKKSFFQHSLFALRHGIAAKTLGLRPFRKGFC